MQCEYIINESIFLFAAYTPIFEERQVEKKVVSLNTYNEKVAKKYNPGHLTFHPFLYNKVFFSNEKIQR